MIKVSIILPIYNVEKYLKDCINSVINQSYKNLEIILVNDGSPDNSDNICKKFIQQDSRIKYIYQKNQGVSIARNSGLELATGDYIYFMDSDDSICSNFIESTVLNAIKNDSDLVIVANNVYNRKNIINYDLAEVATSQLFIKTKFLRKYSIKFPVGFQHFEDTIFTHKLLSLTNKISQNNDAIYYYNIRSDSSSHSIGKNPQIVFHNILTCFELLNDFYEKYQVNEIMVSTLISECFITAYWNYNFTKEQKQVLFESIHSFRIKHNLKSFHSRFSFLSNYMVKQFIKCNQWKNFEIYLVFIHIFKLIKNHIKGAKYNA